MEHKGLSLDSLSLYLTEYWLDWMNRSDLLRDRLFLFLTKQLCPFYANRSKTDFPARTAASKNRKVSGNYGGDFWIATRCGVVHHQNDRLTGAWNLDRPGDNAIRNN